MCVPDQLDLDLDLDPNLGTAMAIAGDCDHTVSQVKAEAEYSGGSKCELNSSGRDGHVLASSIDPKRGSATAMTKLHRP